ncbi:MAG: hypothetical protein NVSMB55_09950 [Mycobacteriales bacterium]
MSYAGNQEDVRLRRVAHLLESQVYVDVGAGDPVEGSVTYWLYLQGWTGVLVEPGSRAAALTPVRPRDLVLDAAVSAVSGELALYKTAPDAGMSTIRADRLAEVLSLGQSVTEVRVPVLTLTEVFARAPGPVSVLSVDVEGAEGEVLGSLDWAAHRPAVVVVEAIRPWSSIPTTDDFEPALTAAGYPRAAFDGVNTWYVDDRHPQAGELRAALSYPVCLLDRWEAAATVQSREAEAAVRQQLDELEQRRQREEQRLDRAQAAAEQARSDAAKSARLLAGEQLRTTELQRQLVQVQAELDDAAGELAAASVGRFRTQARVAELEAELAAITGSTTWRYGAPIAHALRGGLAPARSLRGPTRAVNRWRENAATRLARAREARMDPAERAKRAMRNLTHPAFLGEAVEPAPAGGQGWRAQALAGRDDNDLALRRRLEERAGLRDLTQRAVQVAALAEAVSNEPHATKPSRPGNGPRDRTVLDARCLQDVGLATRGVGRYAVELLEALLEVGHDPVLLLDERLPPPTGVAASVLEVLSSVTSVSSALAARTRWFVQPSPLTAEAWPLTALLSDGAVWCTTLVYDFIPSRYPGCYLRDEDSRLSHGARVRALGLYDEAWAISHSTLAEFERVVGAPTTSAVVWPEHEAGSVASVHTTSTPVSRPYVVIAAGHEHRKNIVGGLGAVALLRRHRPDVCALVVGWSGEQEPVLRAAEQVGLGSEALQLLPYVSTAQLRGVRAEAVAMVVPSFAEGLSLPVLEGPVDGCPVAVSAIPAHVELVGEGPWCAVPHDPVDLSRALEYVIAHRSEVLAAQRRVLDAHAHQCVREVVLARSAALAQPAKVATLRRSKPSLGLVTPWPPQRSGIADYSATTLGPLAERVDGTLYASSSAGPASGWRVRPASPGDPGLVQHDRLLTVIGNSHFHLPGLEIVESYGGAALCHDVRMVELWSYLGIEPEPGAAPAGRVGTRTQRHPLDALPRLGFAHLAKTCDLLLFHSRTTAERVTDETGVRTAALPFVPYRAPCAAQLTDSYRARARARLGLPVDAVHLGLFGGVDVRTKAADVVLEAQAWMRQWGVPVELHVIGGVEQRDRAALVDQAELAGLTPHLHWHGHVAEPEYQDWLLSVDLGVQLRSAALLSLSGAVADLAAFGVPTVATAAMVQDMGLPGFVRAVPDDFSPLLVAEALVAAHESREERSDQRAQYLDEHSVPAYGRALMDALGLA